MSKADAHMDESSTSNYTLSDARSEVNWADLMAAQATGLYSVHSIMPTIVLVDLS